MFYLTILKFSFCIIFSITLFGAGKFTLFNKKTIPNFLKAGANILVLGSSGLFIKDMKIEDALNEVRETIYKAE